MIDNQYIMSPKDLKTLDFLDKVLDAGVRVLKIEGRGRSPEYVKVVTRVYKEAAQAWLKGEWSEDKLEKWNEDLKKVYNRGFWDGYYLGQRVGEWTKKYGSQATTKKTFIGTVTNYFKNISVAEIKIETGELNVGDNIYIMGPTTGVYEDRVEEIRVDLKPTEKTVKGEFCSIATKGVVRRGDKLYLIENTGVC
jgi:putative protease